MSGTVVLAFCSGSPTVVELNEENMSIVSRIVRALKLEESELEEYRT